MLTPLLAHGGAPVGPDAVWGAWHLDPLLLAALAGGVVLSAWEARRGSGRRALLLAGAVAALALAVVSPLDTVSRSLASAHMVQHVLLVAAAAPLLALALPPLRRATLLPLAGAATLAHALALVGWHAAGPYGAALRHDLVHVGEHASFLVTGVAFWAVVAGATGTGVAQRLLLVFAIAMTTVFVGVLMTFAPTPWYDEYGATTEPWGLTPLADQQLAGVLMWVPMSGVYVAAAMTLVAGWLRAADAATR